MTGFVCRVEKESDGGSLMFMLFMFGLNVVRCSHVEFGLRPRSVIYRVNVVVSGKIKREMIMFVRLKCDEVLNNLLLWLLRQDDAAS